MKEGMLGDPNQSASTIKRNHRLNAGRKRLMEKSS